MREISFTRPPPAWKWKTGLKGGDANDDYYIRRYFSSSWQDALTIQQSTGNVGIGSTSPGVKLDVAGDIRTSGILTEKYVSFTPTTVGWYRLATGSKHPGRDRQDQGEL